MAFRIGKVLISFVPDFLIPDFMESPDGGLPPGGVPPSPPGPDTIQTNPADAIELRLLLHTALARLGGPLSAEEMRPRSIDDINQLEASLEEALGEVRRLKQVMK